MRSSSRTLIATAAAIAALLIPMSAAADGTPGHTAIVDPEIVDFGNGGTVTVTVTNGGTDPELVNAGIANGYPMFSIGNNGCVQMVLNPGESCSVDVVYAPTSPGFDHGTVNFWLDSATFSEQVWADLYGSGLPPS